MIRYFRTIRGGGISNDKLTVVGSFPAWIRAISFKAMKNPDFVRNPFVFESANSHIYNTIAFLITAIVRSILKSIWGLTLLNTTSDRPDDFRNRAASRAPTLPVLLGSTYKN